MRRLASILAPLGLFCLIWSGCAKLPSQTPEPGALTLLAEELKDAIPLDYGDLIAVTTSETHPGWAQLWFQREDKSVVVAYVHFSIRRLGARALLIPRS